MALLGAQFVNAVSPNPVGSLQAFAGASAPTGWLLCDGTSYSTSAYPELFNVLGYTYGGSGANFNVPDLRGRIPMGAGTGTGLNASGTGAPTGTSQTARTRGQWGGEETHLLTSAESGVPAHNHPPGAGGTAFLVTNGTATTPNTGSAIASASGTPSTTGNNTAANASSRHSVIPPFVVTNYIIKAIPDAPRSGLAYGSTPPIVTALPSNPQFGDVVTYYSAAPYAGYQTQQWNGAAWIVLDDSRATGAWQSYTPTWTNLSVGNGTQDCAYMVIGETYFVRIKLTFGSTTSVSGGVEFTLPGSASRSSSYSTRAVLGNALYFDSSASASYVGVIMSTTTTSNARPMVQDVSTYVRNGGNVTTGAPMTWATSDTIEAQFSFEAA